MRDLSILIPSRCEMFLKNTVQDILTHIEADTEIIATLDGQWADPQLEQHERLNLIYVNKAVGQRAGANLACRLSRARYVMKIDAHCSFDQGFDAKMLAAFEQAGDNVTMVPIMRNLHAFDWKCYRCGWKTYQGPTPKRCPQCNERHHLRRKILWRGKPNPQSTSYCFDAEPHFRYNEPYKHTEEYKNGAIIGYKLSFDEPSPAPSVINLLTDFADSHHLPGGTYSFWGGENVTVDAMGFSSIDHRAGIGAGEVLSVGDKEEMGGVTTSPIVADVIKDGNVLTSASRQRPNKPSISYPMCELFFSEVSTPSITAFVDSALPVPATSKRINSNVVNELNGILRGEFVYSEKTSSFHNGSVTLTPIYDKGLTETMSLQGSCFMVRREKYWEWELCDETLGNWGNQGIEVAVKTWLVGGRVLCNHRTWYAHLFRTQRGFAMPWPVSGRDQQRTKKNVRDLLWEGRWPKQIHPVSWLVEKFWPVNGWTDENLAALKAIERRGA